MTDSLQLYGTLMTAFCKLIPRATFRDVRRLKVLAWAVVGLCLTKTVNFNLWGEAVISEAQQAESHQRRFHRWLHNPYVLPFAFYFPLLLAALHTWPVAQVMYLALDTTDLPHGYVLIRLALIYRGRAIPVTWRVLKHASTEVSFQEYRWLLYWAFLILPRGQRVVLLVDRGFLHAKLLKLVRRFGWRGRLRAKSNTVVWFPDGRRTTMSELCPPKGQVAFYQGVYVLGEGLGPLYLALANPEGKDEKPWYIVSMQPTDLTTLDEYALRFDTEETFLDDKSNGFQVEASKLDDAQAISRLFLALAVATLHFASVGVAVVKRKTRRWVDTHWQRGMSYLKIGWQWLRQQFRKRWPVMPPFQLDPEPDPEPAMASRRQAERHKRRWTIAHMGGPSLVNVPP
jgi:hypothetical protein